MNKYLLAAGGGILVAGGLLYYYLQQQQPSPSCASYTSSDDCHAHGCYWYDYSCHNNPPDYTPCTEGVDGFCTYEGRQICDSFNNLCMCINPDTGQWQCLEQDAYACHNHLLFKKCVTIDNEVACKLNVGDSDDECELLSAVGCGCLEAPCPFPSWCEPNFDICIRKAAESYFFYDSDCDCLQLPPGTVCAYYLDEPVAANNIAGTIYYKWGPLVGTGLWAVTSVYEGVETIIAEDTAWIIAGDWGSITINESFSTRGIDALVFYFSCHQGTDIRLNKFVGTLAYMGD